MTSPFLFFLWEMLKLIWNILSKVSQIGQVFSLVNILFTVLFSFIECFSYERSHFSQVSCILRNKLLNIDLFDLFISFGIIDLSLISSYVNKKSL